MIYIDPPYNTGNDFVYEDNFAQSTEEYLANSGQFDEEGNRLVKNLDSNGRFHTDWLNMIYPRLKLAKDLLSDDGVIFMSIDDNEIENLRKICNEIFGEENFIAQIIWKKRSTPPNDKVIGAAHEYILSFGKNISNTKLHLRARTQDNLCVYQNPDKSSKGTMGTWRFECKRKGRKICCIIILSNNKSKHRRRTLSTTKWKLEI